jgi:hypothetical protein
MAIMYQNNPKMETIKKETVILSKDKALMSEVEANQNLIRLGDKLLSQGCEVYIVTWLWEGGFSAVCEGLEENFFYSDLQKGWDISDSTKQRHMIKDRFNYV